jgi:hypothetical protein
VNPAPAGPAKGTQLTDRQLIRALRDRVRSADGDPVDTVDVRSDASDVVKFAGVVDDIGADASRTQQAKRDLREKLEEVAELRDQLERDAFQLLSEDESDSLRTRLRAFEERSGEPVLEPGAEEIEASKDVAKNRDAPEPRAKDFHAAVDVRLQAAETKLKDERKALTAREDAIVDRADRLRHAGGADEESNVVRLALETAQKIAAERNRAITAQTDRLEAKNVGALANG